MSLKDIEKDLYNPHSEIDKRNHERSQFDPSFMGNENGKEFRVREEWVEPEKGMSPYWKKIIKIGIITIGSIAILALAVWAFIQIKNSAFDESRVTIEIEGLDKVDSTRLMQYKIKYKNNNRVSLKGAEILLNYSENFQPEGTVNLEYINSNNSKIYLGEIASRSEGEVELKGIFYAPEGYTVQLQGKLQYMPANFNSVFEAEYRKNVNIKSAPIVLEIDAPLETADSNDIEYVVDYENMSSRYFNNVRLEVSYPEGFNFSSALPEPSEGDNLWYLGNLNEGGKGQVRIRGSIKGAENEAKVIKLKIGSLDENNNFIVYSSREKLTRMVAPTFYISQAVNGLTDLDIHTGDELNYKILYRNNGNIGLRNSIITLKIESPVLDFSKLRGGAYDSATNMITWKAVDIPQLANLQPGEEGYVSFFVPVLGRIPIESSQDKNFRVVSVAKIDSPDVPTPSGSNKIIASNRLDLKLTSTVILEAAVYYENDDIQNSGPTPPKVGEETTYMIRWSISNVHNEISDAKVSSSLPTGVRFTGKVYPENEKEKLTFNERTNQIVWDLGTINNGIGILEQKKEIAFQVAVTPQSNQIDKEIILLNTSVVTATDSFTSEAIRAEIKEEDNRTVDSRGYRVVE